jgi:LysR family glycine cleavage system transcriptional activator
MRRLAPLGALRAFEAAARHMSFKDAAAELGVTPTAISHQVRLLEEVCGRKLFRRRPRPLALTGHGERLFPVLREGFDAFAAATAALAEGAVDPPLRITTPNAFAGRWLVPRLPLWRAAHPGLTLQVVGTNAVLDLGSGEADVALRYARQMPAGLECEEMFRDRFFPMGSPALLAGAGPIERAADLLALPLIHFQWARPDPANADWRLWLATARIAEPDLPAMPPMPRLVFSEEQHAIDAAVAGQGVALCSDVVAAADLSDGRLVKAHGLSLPGCGYYLAHLPDHPKRPVIAAFAAWMRSLA